VLARLTDEVPAVQAYAISADDGKDIVESIPKDYAEQAKMKRLGYTSVAEKLAERFHMDISLLKALNPTVAFKADETVAVAIPGGPKIGSVTRIEVRRKWRRRSPLRKMDRCSPFIPRPLAAGHALAVRHA